MDEGEVLVSLVDLDVDLSSAPPEVRELLDDLRAQGWVVHLQRGNRLRMWCSCPRQHNQWVDLKPAYIGYVTDARQLLDRITCFREEGTQ